MCSRIEVEMINNLDDIQVVITRSIRKQSTSFTYNEISSIIKKELTKKGASPVIINSFKVEDMIKETLYSLTDRDRFYCFNNLYTPIKQVPSDHDMIYA